MKKYVLFSGERYYPEGGMEDFKFQSDTYKECLEYLNIERKENKELRWAQIFNTETMKYEYIKPDFKIPSEILYVKQKQFLKSKYRIKD